jgi:hypothetical protein
MADFMSVIEGWQADTEERVDSILQKTTIMIGESLVMLTPVDTGRLRGNWQLTIDRTSNNSLIRYDQDGQSTINDIATDAKTFTAGQMAYIQNHVLYGNDIEWGLYNGPTAKVTDEGFSRQAPQGIVRITEMEFLRIVNDAVRLTA